MTRIKQTEIVPPMMKVAAKMYHQGLGATRIRVARMYMAAENRDGSGMREYLLTRHVNPENKARSSILAAEEVEGVVTLHEVCQEARKQEEQMIMAWYTQMGGAECGPQNLT